MVQFKAKFGNDLTENELPAQAYFEDFQERLAARMLRAETSTKSSAKLKPRNNTVQSQSPKGQYGIHFNSRLTLQTRRKCTSVQPKDVEGLAKYDVISNLWLFSRT